MARFGAPLLFVSYARADQPWADQVVSTLLKRGFEVFYDQESIHAGENFVERIVREIARSDGVVALISEASAHSSWCQAELYQAHALGKRVIPLNLGEEFRELVAPLQRIQRDIQLIRVPRPEDVPRAISKISDQLSAIRLALLQSGLYVVGLGAVQCPSPCPSTAPSHAARKASGPERHQLEYGGPGRNSTRRRNLQVR
jgi:TIR domain